MEALFTSQDSLTSINRWMDKEDMVHTHTHSRILLSHKKECKKKSAIIPFEATLMDLEITILSGISQTEKIILYGITYIWNLKNFTNELIYKTNRFAAYQKKKKKQPQHFCLLKMWGDKLGAGD